jgi:uncharacterized protein
MAGSMVALGETIGREVQVGRSQSVVVSAASGLLLLQRVPVKRALLVVGTLARTNQSQRPPNGRFASERCFARLK